MGLVRNIIIARQFGIGADLDAYYAAFKLPDLLFTVVAGGALATAFIPVFTDVLTHKGLVRAWRLASAITNLAVLIVGVFAVVAAIFAPWLVGTLIAPGFDAAQQAEAAGVMRIVLLSTLIFAVSAIQTGVLHGFKHFLLPALAPVLYPLGIIVGAVWLAPTMGISVVACPGLRVRRRAPRGGSDGTAHSRPGGFPPDTAGHHQSGVAPEPRQRERAGVGLGCDADSRNAYRYRFRIGGISDYV
jgi:hypothetical protein